MMHYSCFKKFLQKDNSDNDKDSLQFKLMRKNKKPINLTIHNHQKCPSTQKLRNLQPRLSMNPSPSNYLSRNPSSHFLTNPNSLQKKKPKIVRKKANKQKQKRQEPTRQTLQSTGDGKWKQNIKLTYCSKNTHPRQITLHNSSLKCLEDIFQNSSRKPAESYSALVETFPKPKITSLILGERERVFLLDWMNYVASELLCRRNTYHAAVAFVDSYLDKQGKIPVKLQSLGAGALLLAVKQEQRESQTYVLSILSESRSGLTRSEIIKMESAIVLSLSFKLNVSTIPFWCDYFSQKWDNFLQKNQQLVSKNLNLNSQSLITFRNPQGNSYKYYREMMQIADALIFHSKHSQFNFSQLALSILYLVCRIQGEAKQKQIESSSIFQHYSDAFARKSSPIFNDPFNFNSIFNEFIVQACKFEITQIIAVVKWVSKFLNMSFTFQIDSRVYQSSANYEQFLRFASYTECIRNYFLQEVVH